MKRIEGGLGMLVSFAVGAMAMGGVMNYETKTSAPETPVVSNVDSVTPSLTPTYEMTPPGVEGDDGSLGGPVYDKAHQTEPTYIYNLPTGR